MDVPLSSDALDLALHPDPSTNLLAVGLISGKVQTIDVTPFLEQQKRGKGGKGSSKRRKVSGSKERDDVNDDEDDEDKSADRLYIKKSTTRFSKKSCRGVEFDHDGRRLWCLSKDKSIYALDASTSQVTTHWSSTHPAAPSRLLPLPNHSNLLVTGDDDGIVNLWDDRIDNSGSGDSKSDAKPVRSYDHHFDWITDFHYSSHLAPPKLTPEQREKKRKEAARLKQRKKQRDDDDGSDTAGFDSDSDDEQGSKPPTLGRERLVCTSGDGSLSVIDFRQGSHRKSTTTDAGSANAKGKKKASAANAGVEVSEDQEDELLSITSVRNGSKLVVGTQLGILSLWAPSRGLLDHIDRIPGHPQSIDALLSLDASTILTGSSDGLIRVVQILPHKFLGVVVDHGMGLPVERMKRKEGLLVSCGHGGEVKCTDISSLLDDDDDDDEDSDDDEEGEDAETLARRLGADSDEDSEQDDEEDDAGDEDTVAAAQDGDEGDSDDDAGDDDDDAEEADSDSDPDSDATPPPPPLPTKQEQRRLKALSAGGHQKDTHDKQDFFADL